MSVSFEVSTTLLFHLAGVGARPAACSSEVLLLEDCVATTVVLVDVEDSSARGGGMGCKPKTGRCGLFDFCHLLRCKDGGLIEVSGVALVRGGGLSVHKLHSLQVTRLL